MWYRVGFVSVAAGVLLCGAGWYLRPIIAARRIGIPWRATLGQSHCDRFKGEEYCTTDWPPHVDAPMRTTLNFEPRTRALMRAERSWSLRDSTTWARLVDSTRLALARRGWEQLPCDSAITHFPIAQAWRAGSQEVQLYAAPVMKVPTVGTRAYLSVQSVPYGGGSCGPRYESRLLTPDEIAQRVGEWLGDQLGAW